MKSNASDKEYLRLFKLIDRNNLKSFDHATKRAKEVSVKLNTPYIPIDNGPNVSPRFDCIEPFKVGDKVSKYFNGDSYPQGTVTHISKSMKKITTSSGLKFYRHKLSGMWIENGTWVLSHGHRDERNPEF